MSEEMKEYDGTEADAMEDYSVYYEWHEEIYGADSDYEGGQDAFTVMIVDSMKNRYEEAGKAKVGDTIQCATCASKFKKKSYQSKFCSNKGHRNCKDRYWNQVDPSRLRRVGL